MTSNGIKRKFEVEKRISFFESDLYTDVVFRCPDSSNHTGFSHINAHKFVLASSSDVFEIMFYGSLPETNTVVVGPNVKFDESENENTKESQEAEIVTEDAGRKKVIVEIPDIEMCTFQRFLRFDI